MSKDDAFGKELAAAHREHMTRIAAIALVLVALVAGASVVGYHYITTTLREPDHCGVCLEGLNETWDCDSAQSWGSEDKPLCQRSRAAEMAECMKLCEGSP